MFQEKHEKPHWPEQSHSFAHSAIYALPFSILRYCLGLSFSF